MVWGIKEYTLNNFDLIILGDPEVFIDTGHLFNTIKETIFLTLVKTIRKTIKGYCDRCQDHGNRGDRWGSTSNTVNKAGDL